MSQKNKESLDSIWNKYRTALLRLEWALDEIDRLNQEIKEKDAELVLRTKGGNVQLRDHLGNPINVYIPGEGPKPAVKKKGPDQEQPDYGLPEEKETDATFGLNFPETPGKGDLCLRTDYVPFRLYKWNNVKWIELDRISTDRFAYNEDYIKYLVGRIQNGEYDSDLLTGPEEEQVRRYLSGK